MQPVWESGVSAFMTQMQYTDLSRPVEGQEERPPLEVALLTWEYPPIPTAKGRAACEVAHGLAAHGVNVRVFTMDRDDTVRTDHSRIEVIGCANRITGLRRLMRKLPGLDHLAAAAAFRERVHEEHERRPFDLIETTNSAAPAAMLADSGLPFVVRASAPYALDAVEATGFSNRLRSYIAMGLEARSVEKSDALISNSRAHAGAIKDWYDLKPGNIHMVTPLSVDPEIRKAGASAPYPPAHARLRLAYVGDDSARKGFAETLQAFDQIVDHARRAGEPLPELHMIGIEPGVLERRLPKLGLNADTRGQLFDYGRLIDSSMIHVLARCHGVLAPSRYQSFGAVYHEAAALGRPLVACAEDATATDFVRRHGTGILADTCSADDIAAATIELFSDRERLMECRRAGLEHAQAWTRESLGAKTLQVYRRAMHLQPIEIPGARQAATPRHTPLNKHHA